MSGYIRRRPTSVGLLSRGKDYSVKDLGGSPEGYTNLLKKELGVSLSADAGGTRWTQLHELSHVRHSLWSPDRIRKRMRAQGRDISIPSILAAEDARINEMLLRRVTDAHEGFRLDGTENQLRRDLQGYVASHASPRVLADTIRTYCNPSHVAAVDAFLRRLPTLPDRELSILRVTVPLAEMLDRLMRGEDPEPKPQSGDKAKKDKGEPAPSKGRDDESEDGGDQDKDEDGSGDGGQDGEDESKGEGDEDRDGGDDAANDADADDAEAFGRPDAGRTDCHGAMPPTFNANGPMVWMIPKVVTPPLTVATKGGNFVVTTAETGTQLRWTQLHRIATDGVVFRRNRRRPGALQRGTVLIDVSGSMSFENDDLAELVAMLPHATVAIYSCTISYGQSAWLVTVGKDGRRVADINDSEMVPRGGGNGCDGPALLWLSRMPTPRIWISDGEAWGVGGGMPLAQAECAAIMEAAGIVQVNEDETGALVARRRFVKHRVDTTDFARRFAPVLKALERGILEG